MAAEEAFVLDTSALLALRSDEPGANDVEKLLLRAQAKRCRLFVSFISRLEILYCIWREESEQAAREALRLVDSFPVSWVSCEPEILDMAGALKAKGGLSLADSWVGATAMVRQASLVHKDPEFVKFKTIRQQMLRN
jgi:predicted nucleic acid-binding protein